MPSNTFFRLRDEKQESILRGAIHEFIEHGFEGAKIADIAKRAGVATGSIYQYFEDKKELYVYCARWSLEMYMKKLGGRADLEKMDIFEYFHDSISKAEAAEEEHELIVFMQRVVKEDNLADESIKAMYDTGDAYIKRLIKNSKDKGVIRTDIDDELLKEYFIAVTDRFRSRLMNMNVDFSKFTEQKQNKIVKKELKQMLELLKKGMGG
jgi:AcrR family transcriptional regulator